MKSLKEINIQMKKFNQILISFSLVFVFSCDTEDLLIEEAVSNQTADSFFSTPAGFEDLSKSIYPLLRVIVEQRELVLNGTDLFASTSVWDETSNVLLNNRIDTYGSELTDGAGAITDLWTVLYKQINRSNILIDRAEAVKEGDATLIATRVAEAKFMRSLCLFWAVQQWGDVPMPLAETTAANKVVTRVASSEIYAQLITDLTAAETALPSTASDYGRATKSAAQHLLARVYLTRGWNFDGKLGGTAADFTQALSYADKVIASHPLVTNYVDLWPKRSEDPTNQTFGPGDQDARNSEVVFAVQYSDQAITNALQTDAGAVTNNDGGNNLHGLFGGGVDDVPGSPGRTSDYNRVLGVHHTTPAIYRLFDPQNDTRYHHNFVEKVYAVVDNNGFIPADGVAPFDIKSGDVVLEFRDWNAPALAADRGKDVVGGTKDYAVINHDEYGNIAESNYHSQNKTPMMWKFWEPGIAYGNGFGEFDAVVMRSAEAYLIAAEAIVKGGTGGALGGASDYYNATVNRAVGGTTIAADQAADPAGTSLATASYRATGAPTIDMILDERARELMGEGLRWYDLKRTEKLIDRAKAMNPWVKGANTIQSYHLLRPIPLSESDLSTNEVTQNTGY
jgi:hypothetical protein